MNVTSLDPALLSAGFNRGFPRGPSSNQKFHKVFVRPGSALSSPRWIWWRRWRRPMVPSQSWPWMLTSPQRGKVYSWRHGVRSSRWQSRATLREDPVHYISSEKGGISLRWDTWGDGNLRWSWSMPRKLWKWPPLTKSWLRQVGQWDQAMQTWHNWWPRTMRQSGNRWTFSNRTWSSWRRTSRPRWRSWRKNASSTGATYRAWFKVWEEKLYITTCPW